MSFEGLLRPQSIAVIGASSTPGRVGHDVLRNIIEGGFEGEIYPINPKVNELMGKKSYASVKDIPGPVDCAVIAINRDLVIPMLLECSEKSIHGIVVITAGFKETGPEGKKLQLEITRIAQQNNMTLLGPNCLGLINPWHKLNASFGQKLDTPGSIACISQSGALITAMQDMAASNKIGFSLLASLGNKATLDEVAFFQNLQSDPTTRVIAAYLEDISKGQEFMRVAERVSKSKPILILKSGRTSAGAKAASSHTGSLAGADSAYQSAFERTGVIRVNSIEHLFDVAMAFAYQPLPQGDKIAVVTNAGGPGIMMSDALESAGLRMATIDEETEKKLSAVLPAAASTHNPVDVLGDAGGDRYAGAIDTLLASNSVDGLVVILTPQTMTDDVAIAKAVVELAKKYTKPVFACFMGAGSIRKGVEILQTEQIPQYSIPERAAAAMLEMVRYARYKRRPLRVVERFAVNKNPVIKTIKTYLNRQKYEIGENDAKNIMEAYNFNVPAGMLATSVEEAVRFASDLGYPVAMKISSPDILHKSDVGGVRVGLANAAAVEDAFELMMLRVKRKKPEAQLQGVLVEKMIMGGKEVILGMKKDPQFGPVLMFGLGGIFVEVLKDVVFGLAPLTEEECRKMIEGTRSYKILRGVRGGRPVDINAVVVALQRLSQLVMDFPEIEEVDINPLMAGAEGDGAFVVDARIILSKENA
jgi:acetate---CoA ligase (ADP-forming)